MKADHTRNIFLKNLRFFVISKSLIWFFKRIHLILRGRIVKESVDKSLAKLYMRHVNDTLLLVKDKDIDYIHKRWNSFDKNIKLTVDIFPNSNVHFLDIKVDKNHTDIYYKDTHAGQYTSLHSQTFWRLKTAWIKPLFHCANKTCSTKQVFQQQIDHIKRLMSWNAYPKYVRNSIINRLKSNVNRNGNTNNNKVDRKVIWINLPYLGKKDETNSLIKKLKRSFKGNVKFKTIYKTRKLSMLCNTKDSISVEQKSNVIYSIKSAISFWKILRKHVKAKLDIEFLKKCKSADVHPKFVRWKNVKNKKKKEKNKLYKADLNDAIKARHNDFRKLQKQHVD